MLSDSCQSMSTEAWSVSYFFGSVVPERFSPFATLPPG